MQHANYYKYIRELYTGPSTEIWKFSTIERTCPILDKQMRRMKMKSILPIADFDLAKKVKEIGFHEPVFAKYQNGILCDDGCSAFKDYNGLKKPEVISAPSLQEIQVWLSKTKRMDVLVYRDIFFGEVGSYYAVIIRRKDGLTRESKRVVSSNLALKAGIRTAVTLLCKKGKRK